MEEFRRLLIHFSPFGWMLLILTTLAGAVFAHPETAAQDAPASNSTTDSSTGSPSPSPRFFRGINLNGPAVVIDGNQWEAGKSPLLRCDADAFEMQAIPLTPGTDIGRATMIRSSCWGREIEANLLSVPDGVYQVLIYVWEDNAPERYAIEINGHTVEPEHVSGMAGAWERLGPWQTVVTDGRLKISGRGGALNLSGIEVWSGVGQIPEPFAPRFETQPSDKQLAFFESRIRPLLIDNCYSCHSTESEEPGGGLLLDSRSGIISGGSSGSPVIPGDPDNSLLMKAVGHRNPDLAMPPDSHLSEDQIADLAEWIRMKAPDPRLEDTVASVKARSEIDWQKARDFWSLKPLTRPAIPTVRSTDWPHSSIDYFVLNKVEAAGLSMAEDADRRALIRRATFDLTGLPPSPEEIERFLGDTSETAWEVLIDRLLASPRYGERWGRYWLDVVRYSDTAGDNSDFPIPQMYLYRNWVIDAFNRDLPYDQFVRDQLAGDLVPGDQVANDVTAGATDDETRGRIIATGYIANARRFGSRVADYPQHLTIEDTLDNVGKTFLGTTINCARCHNHKFDPITTEDYYALYGIFHSTRYPWPGIELEQRQRDLVILAGPENIALALAARQKRQSELDAEVERLSNEQKNAKGEAAAVLKQQLKKAQEAARDCAAEPLPFETIYGVAESSRFEDVAVQLKGDPSKPGPIVPRRFLKAVNGTPLHEPDKSSGRLQLAEWITDPANPLTARVMVNRIWLNHFGTGLVPTPNDFGRQGRPPTHPELLDWLAQQFIDSGWSIRKLHRTIMLSHVYRTSSLLAPNAIDRDPSNELLSSFPRRRLDAEAIRDTMLLLSGNLDISPGGEHPFPPQAEWNFTQHKPFKAVYETNRRSVYLMTQRIQRHPYLAIFDGSDPSVSTPFRLTSTTPLQALYLLNDKFVHEQAAGIAQRLLNEEHDEQTLLKKAWLLMFGRFPDEVEVAGASRFLARVQEEQTNEKNPRNASWQALIRSLLRLNEFVYVD